MKTVFTFIIGIQPAAISNGLFHIFSHFSHTFIYIENSHLVNDTPSTDLVSLILLQQQGKKALSTWILDMLFRRLINDCSSLASIPEESSGSLSCLITPDHESYPTAIIICDNLIILTLAKAVLIPSFYEIWWVLPLIIFYKVSYLSSWQPCALYCKHLVKSVYNIETVELKNKIICHVLNSIQ